MTRHPDSRLTRFRRRLAKAIEPAPAAGEAWCVDCTLNDGHTIIISPDGIVQHLKGHVPDEHITVQSAWPA